MDCLRLNPDSILQCDLCLISYSQKIGIKNETMNARHSVLSKCSTNFMYLSVYLSLVVSSAGKKSTCNAGDPGSIPGLGRSTQVFLGFPCGSTGKESACNAGDLDLIPGLGRSPGESQGYPLQYSGLENSMDCIVPGAQIVRHN